MRLSSRTVLLIGLLVVMALVLTDTLKVRKARRLSKLTRRNTVERPIHFSCLGRPVGYYADVENDCRVFHICDNFGRRVPMFCPAQTKFNQMYRVCDWASAVDCPASPDFYYMNGQQPPNSSPSSTSTFA